MPRRRRWPIKALVGLAVLLAGIVWWLRWEPAEPEEARDLMPVQKGAPPRAAGSAVVPDSSRASMQRSPTLPPGWPPSNTVVVLPGSLATNAANGSNHLARPPSWKPRAVLNILEAQIALARLGISPGPIDALDGPHTQSALRAFQKAHGLKVTGTLDSATRSSLVLGEPPYTNYVVTGADLERLLPVGATWLEKSRQPRLDYETIEELVAEKWRCHPKFLRQHNQAVAWSNITAGTSLMVPHVRPPLPPDRAAWVRILLSERVLQAFDGRTNLLVHFPCSIARNAENRPVGELRVSVLVSDPEYMFKPARFPASPEARDLGNELRIPPGPNNPVGTVWIGLEHPGYALTGYGIHGTPHPERVGQAESLGCFRLANWNAEHLLRLSWVGMPVRVEP